LPTGRKAASPMPSIRPDRSSAPGAQGRHQQNDPFRIRTTGAVQRGASIADKCCNSNKSVQIGLGWRERVGARLSLGRLRLPGDGSSAKAPARESRATAEGFGGGPRRESVAQRLRRHCTAYGRGPDPRSEGSAPKALLLAQSGRFAGLPLKRTTGFESTTLSWEAVEPHMARALTLR